MSSVLEKIRELDAQKAQLLSEAKKEAMAAAHKAIASLAELGFNYSLVQGEGSGSISRAPRMPGTRRSGVREEVLAVIEANPSGLGRAAILKEMGAEDKASQQSISNALAALKKVGTVTADGGLYKAR
ncbi:hypothetical protein [Novosphingobium aquae]|uniref:Uncharacterized protein n=1 Tax=Novosphingobium aquae TaxID=3133435 RepID=A0ABU8SBS0_9SPHN